MSRVLSPPRIEGFVGNPLTAAVVLFVIGISGVLVGVLVAQQWVGHTSIEDLQNLTNLRVNDMFPDYELWDAKRETKTTIANIVASGPALLVFMNRSCGACRQLAEYWNKRVIPELRSDIQAILIYDDDDWYGSPPDSLPVFELTDIMTMNRGELVVHDGITMTPTVVALDGHRVARLICSGFDRRVGSEFVNTHL